ncbi:hypothetical protein CMI47_07275 [Candidatus Pacearchaeota archaeon]|jgi:hypothetical protein|nr:hypothetical protein [Candidatus Pacearchaeota archaeon]|tara:strand:+ start:92 stop:766 length:675 start_codon:yes stop_codon:yes gene_type:complete
MASGYIDFYGNDITELDETILSNILRTPALKKAMDKIYRDLHRERSKKDTGGLWDFPIINTIRGKVQTRRFIEGIEKRDILVGGVDKKNLRETDKGQTLGAMQSSQEGLKLPKINRYIPFINKKDSLISMALKPEGGSSSFLQTLIHEGGHMPPIIGRTIRHDKIGQEVFGAITNKHLEEAFKALSKEELNFLKKQINSFRTLSTGVSPGGNYPDYVIDSFKAD